MTPCDLSHFPSRDFQITYNQFQLRKFKSFGSFVRWWRWWVIPWAPNSKLFFKSIDDCWISSSPSTTSDLHWIRRYWSSTSKLHPCLNLLFDNKYLLPQTVFSFYYFDYIFESEEITLDVENNINFAVDCI